MAPLRNMIGYIESIVIPKVTTKPVPVSMIKGTSPPKVQKEEAPVQNTLI
jgi:hypothetical protein